MVGKAFLEAITFILPLLLSIAFLTLFERKVLASIQRRRGPNRVGIYGLLQPIADGLKLIMKESLIPLKTDYSAFTVAPMLAFIISLFNWVLVPWSVHTSIVDNDFSLLFFFAFSSMGTFSILLAGWASNSKYAMLGAVRTAAQYVSYEIILGLIIIGIVYIARSADIMVILRMQAKGYFWASLLPFFIVFVIAVLAETNRVPFDLPEAESELVSGYNVEYSAIMFAFFFLAEYSNMILMACIINILFLAGHCLSNGLFGLVLYAFKIVLFLFLFVWVRATLPRYRFDQLMRLGWLRLIPIIFGYLMLIIGSSSVVFILAW
jgi:NADH-quinone oxidoreductase subunit H